jgi:hypothetical protein
VSYHEEIGEGARRNTRMEPGSGKGGALWTVSSRKTGPKSVWKGLVDLSTMSHGSTLLSEQVEEAAGQELALQAQEDQ